MKKTFEAAKLILITNIVIALSISLLVWLLSLLLYLMQNSADHFGYTFLISEEIKKTVLAVGGAIVVAVVAFYGVHTQNISAEKRHKTDKELDLKKDIF
ncbi:MAG: hypothetical protein ACXWIN_10930 [Burkholderiaceae bacterium]